MLQYVITCALFCSRVQFDNLICNCRSLAMAGLIARRTKRPRHCESGNGQGQHMFMPGNMQQQQQLMMMPAYPYMNPGMMANNPIMMSPMSMNPCTGMSPNTPMTMQAPHGLPTMMQPMQASPAGFSANAIPVDDMTDDEEPDTAGVPEQQQQPLQGVGESASGSEAAKAPPLSPPVAALPLLPPPSGEHFRLEGSSEDTACAKPGEIAWRGRGGNNVLQLCQCRQWFDVCSEQLTSQKLQWVGGRVPGAAQPEGLLVLLWMMTRLAPSIRIGHLRDLSDVQLGANQKNKIFQCLCQCAFKVWEPTRTCKSDSTGHFVECKKQNLSSWNSS